MAEIADILNGLTSIINGGQPNPAAAVPPKPLPSIGPDALLPKEWADQLATIPVRAASTLAQFPTGAYSLASKGIGWMQGQDEGLPGGAEAGDITEQIKAPADKVISDITGGAPVSDSLIHGSMPELAANWGSLALGGFMNIPALGAGIKALRGGTSLVEKASGEGLNALSYLSPVMLHQVGPIGAAVNTAIPGALGVGLETLFPKPEALDAAAKEGADTAVAGVDQTAQVHKAATPIQASFGTGNPWVDGALVAVGGIVALGAMKRDVFNRVLGGMTKEGETTGSAVDTLRNQIVDRNATMKSSVYDVLEEAKRPNFKAQGDIFANKVDASQGSAIDTKLRGVYRDGEIPNSAVKLPPPQDFYTKLKGVDPQVQSEIADALNKPRSLWSTLSPQVQPLVNEYDSIARRLLDYTVEQKYMTPRAANELRQLNTHELMTAMDRGPEFVKGVKQLSDPLPGDVLGDMPSYIESTIRKTEWNKTKALYVGMMRDLQDVGNAKAAEILGARDIPIKQHNRDNVITYRDRNGMPKTQVINDEQIFNALKTGTDMTRLHSVGGIMSKAARFYESSATGTISTMLAQPFAHVAALYNAGFGAALREPGTAAGRIDKLLQDKGIKFGLPGDPTIVPESIYHALTGIQAVVAKRVGNILHDIVVSKGGASNSTMEQLAQGLSNHYKKNWIAHFQEQGLLGPATMEGINPDVAIKSAQQSMMTAGIPRRVLTETMGILKDTLHAISSSPTATIWSLNKGLHPDLRARAVREFSGDPGRAGAFQGRGLTGATLAHGTSWTPYGNIFLQAGDKFIKALVKNPLSAATGIATTVGAGVLSQSTWNARLGREYSDYQYNRRSNDAKAANVYFGLPGLHPEQGLEIPVDPLMRPFKLAYELLVGHQLGLLDGSMFKPENEGQKNALTEMVSNNWLSMGKDSVANSVIQQTLIPPVPPPIAAGANLMGKNLRAYGDVSEIHSRTDAGFTNSDARDPMREFFGIPESANMEQVVRSLGANSLSLAYNMFMDGTKRVDEGKGYVNALDNAWKMEKLAAQDRSKQFSGALFGSFAALSPTQESAAELLTAKTRGLTNLIQDTQAMIKSGAYTGGQIVGNRTRGFQALLGGNIAVTPNDPRLIQFGQMAQIYQKQLEGAVIGPNKDTFTQMNGIRNSTELSPAKKREALNGIQETIVDRNRMGLMMTQQFEAAMATMFNVKQIRLDKYKPGGDVSDQNDQ